MGNIEADPRRGVSRNRPDRAVDSCFTTDGSLIASERSVWDGVLEDRRRDGACTQQFPIYSSSRREAGAPFEGGIWKCATRSVRRAIDRGVYGAWRSTAAERQRLAEIFPDGVCDYRRPDVGAAR